MITQIGLKHCGLNNTHYKFMIDLWVLSAVADALCYLYDNRQLVRRNKKKKWIVLHPHSSLHHATWLVSSHVKGWKMVIS